MTYKSSTKVSKTRHIRKQPLEVFCQKVLSELSQYLQENTCAGVSFLIKVQALACNVIKKETLAQVFFCEFGQMSKNTFFTDNIRGLLLHIRKVFGLQTEFLKMSKEEFLISKYLVEIFRRSSQNTSRWIKTSF